MLLVPGVGKATRHWFSDLTKGYIWGPRLTIEHYVQVVVGRLKKSSLDFVILFIYNNDILIIIMIK